MDDNQTKKGNFDPGWNDPPKLTYNATVQLSKPRNLLNKRVAFPLNSNVPPTVAIPPTQTYNFSKLSTNQGNTPSSLTQAECQAYAAEVKDIFNKLLRDNNELGTKAFDVQKRLDVMENAWNNGSLEIEVMYKMRNLAIALRENRPMEADNIHKELVCDHSTSVGSWMAGIRHLINHCIVKSDLLSIDSSENSQ